MISFIYIPVISGDLKKAPVAKTRQGKRIEEVPMKGQKFLRTGVVLLLSVAMVLFSLNLAGERGRRARIETIQVGDRLVEVDKSLARNTLQQEAFFKTPSGRAVYSEGTCMQGIDVSVFQEDIDWSAVARDGVAFAFIRAGYRGYANGTIVQDELFEKNLQGASENGLKTGVYFFSQAMNEEEAREEAEFVLSALRGQKLDMPVVFDWEAVEQNFDEADTSHAPIRTAGMDGKTVTDCALAFCEEIQAAGYEPMVYLNNDTGYFLYDISRLQGIKLWYAAYRSHWADFYYQIDAWQYTEQGKIKGIDGMVDLDLWFMLEEQSGEK